MSLTIGSDVKWYSHPNRPCKGDETYYETSGISYRDKERKARACVTDCPVYYECFHDLLRWTEAGHLHYGIQAGIIGKA